MPGFKRSLALRPALVPNGFPVLIQAFPLINPICLKVATLSESAPATKEHNNPGFFSQELKVSTQRHSLRMSCVHLIHKVAEGRQTCRVHCLVSWEIFPDQWLPCSEPIALDIAPQTGRPCGASETCKKLCRPHPRLNPPYYHLPLFIASSLFLSYLALQKLGSLALLSVRSQ